MRNYLNLDQWFSMRCRLKKKFMDDERTKTYNNRFPFDVSYLLFLSA